MRFTVNIPDDLFEEIKRSLEDDVGEDYTDEDNTAVFADILREGTGSFVLEDMDKLKTITVEEVGLGQEEKYPDETPQPDVAKKEE